MARLPFRRGVTVPGEVLAAAPLEPGEKVLAGCRTVDGRWLLGTRDAVLLPSEAAGTARIPWERVERADWDRDEERLRVLEVGEFGRPRPAYAYAIREPGLLVELIRERVTASIVLQRHVPVAGRRGLYVLARRPPRGVGEITWAYEFEPGIDPADPEVMAAARRGLAAAEEEIGQ
jgi:hypothetical protein